MDEDIYVKREKNITVEGPYWHEHIVQPAETQPTWVSPSFADSTCPHVNAAIWSACR